MNTHSHFTNQDSDRSIPEAITSQTTHPTSTSQGRLYRPYPKRTRTSATSSHPNYMQAQSNEPTDPHMVQQSQYSSTDSLSSFTHSSHAPPESLEQYGSSTLHSFPRPILGPSSNLSLELPDLGQPFSVDNFNRTEHSSEDDTVELDVLHHISGLSGPSSQVDPYQESNGNHLHQPDMDSEHIDPTLMSGEDYPSYNSQMRVRPRLMRNTTSHPPPDLPTLTRPLFYGSDLAPNNRYDHSIDRATAAQFTDELAVQRDLSRALNEYHHPLSYDDSLVSRSRQESSYSLSTAPWRQPTDLSSATRPSRPSSPTRTRSSLDDDLMQVDRVTRRPYSSMLRANAPTSDVRSTSSSYVPLRQRIARATSSDYRSTPSPGPFTITNARRISPNPRLSRPASVSRRVQGFGDDSGDEAGLITPPEWRPTSFPMLPSGSAGIRTVLHSDGTVPTVEAAEPVSQRRTIRNIRSESNHTFTQPLSSTNESRTGSNSSYLSEESRLREETVAEAIQRLNERIRSREETTAPYSRDFIRRSNRSSQEYADSLLARHELFLRSTDRQFQMYSEGRSQDDIAENPPLSDNWEFGSDISTRERVQRRTGAQSRRDLRRQFVMLETLHQLEGITFRPDAPTGLDPRNYIADDEFDTSYEALTRLQEEIGFHEPGRDRDLKVFLHQDWTSTLIKQEKDTRCSICLTDYEDTDECSTPGCQHGFHKSCLSEWLIKSGTCPVCRYDPEVL